ncbi:MAG TPA: phosphotransferase [Candidatus Limnocylindrales bacterium]|nr:phosphotransferase [Candidatus Limnocylindrales bacterium]
MPPLEPPQRRSDEAGADHPTTTRPPHPTAVEPPDAGEVVVAFDLGRPSGTMTLAARGELGRIWQLETTAGRWAVKELFRGGEEAAARADVAFQEAALSAGVRMPRPVVAPDGRVLHEVGAGDRRVDVRVYTWVDLAGREHRAPAIDAAGILGRIHAIGYRDDGPADPWFLEMPSADRWAGLLHAATGAGVAWLGTLESLVPSLLEGGPLVALGRHEPTIRCHRDFNPENVLLDGAGVAVVVDWENSGPAAAEQELASALAEFVPDPAGTTTFLRAYRDAGGTATLRDRSSFAMTLAVQANLVAWYAARALDPAAAAEDRARSEHWIRDIAANVFTIDRIDGWLRAASAT